MQCFACNTHLYDEFVVHSSSATVEGAIELCLDCDLYADTVDLNDEDSVSELPRIVKGIL